MMANNVPKGRVEFEVVGGMCRLQFDPAMNCGPDPECNPGVGFALIADAPPHLHDGKYYSGLGVFSRTDARRVRDMLDLFLNGIDPGDTP